MARSALSTCFQASILALLLGTAGVADADPKARPTAAKPAVQRTVGPSFKEGFFGGVAQRRAALAMHAKLRSLATRGRFAHSWGVYWEGPPDADDDLGTPPGAYTFSIDHSQCTAAGSKQLWGNLFSNAALPGRAHDQATRAMQQACEVLRTAGHTVKGATVELSELGDYSYWVSYR